MTDEENGFPEGVQVGLPVLVGDPDLVGEESNHNENYKKPAS